MAMQHHYAPSAMRLLGNTVDQSLCHAVCKLACPILSCSTGCMPLQEPSYAAPFPQCLLCSTYQFRCCAGHNGCLQCMATVRRSKSECPLCRQAIPASTELVINRELRDLVTLASALHTVDQDGWEAVASNNTLSKSHKL